MSNNLNLEDIMNLYEEVDGVFDVMAGSRISNTIAEAITLSKREGRPITFMFNEVKITVTRFSKPNLIFYWWKRALTDSRISDIGPYPNEIPFDREKKIEARREAKRERARQKQRVKQERAYEKLHAKQKRALQKQHVKQKRARQKQHNEADISRQCWRGKKPHHWRNRN